MGIRKATPADAAALAGLHLVSWRAAYRGIMPEGLLGGLTVEWFLERWERHLGDRAAATVLLDEDGGLRGFVAFGPSRDGDAGPETAEVHALYVHPGHWRCGVGSSLCRAALVRLWAKDYRDATVWTLEANARARGFYERMGFRLQPRGRREFGRRLALPELRYFRGLAEAPERATPPLAGVETQVAPSPVSLRGEMA